MMAEVGALFPEAEATLTFHMEVGRLAVGSAERELCKAAHACRVSITLNRALGWFAGYLLVTVEGKSNDVMRFKDAIEGWRP